MSSLAQERRAARERALSLLYEAEAKGREPRDVVAELPAPPDPYVVDLIEALEANRVHIDALIGRFAKGWTIERMPALDRAALRMGSAELLDRPDVPTGVVLAEIVDLASRFSTERSGRFVNGLLARIAEEVRGDGAIDAPAGSDRLATAEPPGPESRQVDALVIDLDGVIRHWDADAIAEIEAGIGVPRGALSRTALDPKLLEQAMDGRLSFDEWCAEIGTQLASEHGANPKAAARAWASTPWSIDLDVIDLVRSVRRRGAPVVLLSNASSRLEVDLEESGILEEFDAAVSSAVIGAAKPQPGAYAAAAAAIGVPLSRCLFVDDVAANVEGAAATGMQAERFTGVEELRALLEEVGLL